MELIRIDIVEAPGSERVRLVGKVAYDRGSPLTEELWYEVPRAYAEHLSTDGTPWLATLLPLAVTLNEPLRIAQPVDAHRHPRFAHG